MNTVPIVDVPRVGQVQVAPRPPQPLRSLGVVCEGAERFWDSFLSTNREREDSFRKQKEDP